MYVVDDGKMTSPDSHILGRALLFRSMIYTIVRPYENFYE